MEDTMKQFFTGVFLLTILLTSVVTAAPTPAPAGDGPDTYMVMFFVNEYNAKVGDAVEFFFKKVLKPEDQLSILTPVKPYSFSQNTRQAQGIDKLIDMTKKVLKRDIMVGAANYQQSIEEQARLVIDMSGGGDQASGGLSSVTLPGSTSLKTFLVRYNQLLTEYRNSRKLTGKLLSDLASLLKRNPKNNHIYLFYQKEVQYIPTRHVMDALMQVRDIRFSVMEAFEGENTKQLMDTEKIIAALKDAQATLDFVYVSMRDRRRQGAQIREFSNDMYGVLSKVAKATGGQVIATSKPEAALKKINKK